MHQINHEQSTTFIHSQLKQNLRLSSRHKMSLTNTQQLQLNILQDVISSHVTCTVHTEVYNHVRLCHVSII